MAEVKPPTAGQDGLISKDQACRLLMITPQWLNRLMASGYIPKAPRGKVSLVGAVQGYIKSLKDEDRRSSKSAADNRVRDARAAEIEMRIAEKRRELVPRDEAEATNDFVVGTVNEVLNGLAARLTRDIATRRKYETEIDGAKARIKKALETAAECLETGRDLPFTDTENDA